MKSCPACRLENPDGAHFCMSCGSSLSLERSARETRKTVTVVFSDVVGSTTLGERLDPELVRSVMGRYFDEMRTVLERHGGTVEKFIGDAIMAVFGIPVLHEDDALRAVRAAVEMRARLSALNAELAQGRGITLASRVGVNTGEVVAGDPSSGQRLVTGDAVNVAARLEQAAAPGEVILGEATYGLLRDIVRVEPIAPLALKGKSAPVAAFRLLAVQTEAARVGRRFHSAMVGRERHLGMLLQTFESAVADRSCHLFTVLGAAGVGKSRLVHEFLQRLPPGTRILGGRCLSYGEGITFWPLAELLREAAVLRDDHHFEERREKIAALLGNEEQAGPIADRLAELLGTGGSSAAPQETFWAARKFLETLAKQRPLVVLFEDIHWAEPTFLDLVEYVADWTRGVPLLLLCTSRLELLDRRSAWAGGKLNATSILLDPLPDEKCQQLINNLLGATQLPENVSRRILEAAGGIPLFVEETMSMLIDEGLLRRAEDAWIPAGNLSTVQISPSIQALLAARIDQLPAEERTVLECGAVEGKVFHVGALAELAPEPLRGHLSALLMSLTRRELLRPDRAELVGEEAFGFRHQLIRDAAYNRMPKGQRARLHELFAAWLERIAAQTGEFEEIRGYHLEQAYQYGVEVGHGGDGRKTLARRAAKLFAAAGQRAMNRGDMPGAANLLERTVALYGAGRDRIEAILLLSSALREMGQLRRAKSLVEEAMTDARGIGDRRLDMHVRIERARVISRTDPDEFVTEAEAVSREAIPLFEALADHNGLAEAWEIVALRLNLTGHPPEMVDAHERAIEHSRLAGDRQAEFSNIAALASTLYWGATPVEEGIRRIEEMLDRVRGHRFIEARIRRPLTGFMAMQGRFDEARGLLRELAATFEELGAKLMLTTMSFWTGELEFLAGDPRAGEQAFRESCEALGRMGELSWYCSRAAALAEALYVQGRYDEAYEWTVRSEEAAGAGDFEAQAAFRAIRAKILARRGSFAEAERMARQAVEIVHQTGELNHEGNRYSDLAAVLRLAGKTTEAVDALRQAIQRWDLKGNVISAGKGRAELATLIAAE